MNIEIWKDIPGFKGRYQASNLGRIKSIDWKSSRGFLRKGKIMKQCHEGNGYLQLHIVTNNGSKMLSAHRLIAKAFLPTTEGKEFVNHKNGIKDDNRIENLEWCSKSENCKHSFEIGLQDNKGEKHPCSKLSEIDVLTIRKQYSTGKYSHQQIADVYDISKTQVGDIIRKRSWTHI